MDARTHALSHGQPKSRMPPAAIDRRVIKTRNIIDSFEGDMCVINPLLYASRSFKVTDVGNN